MEHAILVAELTSRWSEHRVGPVLSRIPTLMDLSGNPERTTLAIQMVETNGRGLTYIMIDTLLRAAGLRMRRLSSPHLSDARERIPIDGEPISEERFIEAWGEIEPLVRMMDGRKLDGIGMTLFKVITGVAYVVPADALVDVAVVEVGLGGSRDAASVATPQVSVVSPIGLNHTHILGDSLGKVTSEKADIIKPGVMTILTGQESAVARMLLARAVEVGAVAKTEGSDFGLLERCPAAGGQATRIQSKGGPVRDLFLPLHGAHMAHNTVLSVVTVEASLGGQPLGPRITEEGLASVVAPARFELVRTSPAIIVDTAHNPQAARATIEACRGAFASQPLIGVVGMVADKDTVGVLETFASATDRVVVIRARGTPRSLPVDKLARIAEETWPAGEVQKASGVAGALELATLLANAAGPAVGVLVARSLIVAGEARDLLAREQETNS